MNEYGRAWTTREVAQRIGVGESTARKWSISLEKAGYKFLTKENGEITTRFYVEHDILVLMDYKELMQEKDMTMEIASQRIVERYGERDNSILPIRTESVRVETHDEISQLRNEIKEFNKELIERLEQRLNQQEQYIKESLERRDQELTQVMRSLLESASAEAQKKPWWKIWR